MYENLILQEFELNALIACEIEFYLEPCPTRNSDQEKDFLAKLLLEFSKTNIKIHRLDKEVTEGQFEISLTPQKPNIAINEINWTKEFISKTAKDEGYQAIFEAKPLQDLPGSGLHIHISLVDNSGISALKRIDEKTESETMLYAIGGLCDTMLKNFIYFAPNENSYLRFTSDRNNHKQANPMVSHNNAPVNVSWGGNNRTTAIRIPASTIDENSRHIEHRVAGADANPADVINKILEGVYLGLKEKIIPPQKIYGNAYDKQYQAELQPFPKTLSEALKLSKKFMN
ncbi:MAG: hypothetical protein SFT90_02625 [Rickettsiales bacterium]|nr:hypothetical protein [Rickettsiales bacterium]